MGALATKGRLYDRHVVEDAMCFHCADAYESILHAIFHCPLESDVWSTSPFSHYIADGPTTSFMDFFVWIKSKLQAAELLSFMALAWAAWSYRNSVYHGEPWKSKAVGVVGFVKLVKDYQAYAVAVHSRVPSITSMASRSRWIPPGVGRFRINTDATVLGEDGIGMGMVVRDEAGCVKLRKCGEFELDGLLL